MKIVVCRQFVETAKLELKKFLRLFVAKPRRMGMLAIFNDTEPCLVDAVWHQQVENVESYNHFCRTELGEFVAHLGVECERATLAWVIDYERTNGPLPDVWFRNSKGMLDTKAYDTYLEDYRLHLSEKRVLPNIENAWKCSPGTLAEKQDSLRTTA